jgi:hypothetical protein
MRALALLLMGLTGAAHAATIPYENWEAQSGGLWSGGGGACALREELHGQSFATLDTQDAAAKFAGRLQRSLVSQKLGGVVTQAVERPGQWGVLASYLYTDKGERYKVVQLFLSSGGKLRTFTGSAKHDEFDQCVNDMQAFVRYLAN